MALFGCPVRRLAASVPARVLGPRPASPARGLSSFHRSPTSASSIRDPRIIKYAQRPLLRFQMCDLLDFASSTEGEEQLLQSAKVVSSAVPIRLAKRITRFHSLPFIVGMNPYMQRIHEIYVECFHQLVEHDNIQTMEDEMALSKALGSVLRQAKVVLPLLAKASKEISEYMPKEELQEYLNTFLESRISRRVLSEQHIALHDHYYNPDKSKNAFGTLGVALDPASAVRAAFATTSKLTMESYGVAPDLVISGEPQLSFSYIPSHLHYMLLELLKNASRAVVERHSVATVGDDSRPLPPIKVSVFFNEESTTFRIVDQGGGIPLQERHKVWDYAYSTVDPSTVASGHRALKDLHHRNMAGEGFGLPMVRVYARYWGGDLEMQTIEGHGTDMFLRLGHISREHISRAVENKTAPIR